MGKPRVLLADDHVILLEGVRSLLEPEFDIVGTVTDGRALLEAARRLRPQVIVFDISMPLLNGLEAARMLRKSNPDAKLIVLTMHSDVSYAREAFEAGVAGYVVKHAAGNQLATAIREVMLGRRHLSETLRHRLGASDGRWPSQDQSPGHELTPRQREVLQLIAEGFPAKEIAWRLDISLKTVEYHKYRIMDQLGIRTTAEITAYAIRHGIISAG